jgi:hypothetical protein
VIAAMKKPQSRFEKSMEEKQKTYEVKLDEVTKSMQNDLTIANKKITKIHDAIKTHVTEEFLEARLTANTNGLIAWLQENIACRPKPQSVEEEPRDYMHIDKDENNKRKSEEMSLTNTNPTYMNISDEEGGNTQNCHP